MTPIKSFKQTWGDDFFTSRGFTMVPNAVLEFAAKLHLHSKHIAVITAALYWKWDSRRPYPSIDSLAAAAGCSNRTVQRALDDLEHRNLVKVLPGCDKNGGQTSNLIDFTPLREAINGLSRVDLPAWAHEYTDPRQASLPLETESDESYRW